jgi:hypothetical protein
LQQTRVVVPFLSVVVMTRPALSYPFVVVTPFGVVVPVQAWFWS